MKPEEYQNSYAWQQAIDLSLHLQNVIEELPDEEKHSFSQMLREAMVSIPGNIARCLIVDLPADYTGVTRLQATLTVINRVYPAIDTADAQTALDELIVRIGSREAFVEQKPQPQTQQSESEE